MFRKVGKKLNTGPPKKIKLYSNTKKTLSLKELHELYIKYKIHAVGTSKATIKNYQHNFQLLLQFKPDITLSDLTEGTIVNFMEFLNTRHRKVGNRHIVRVYKNSSIASVRGKLNSFFNWLIERDYLEESPYRKIKYPDVSYTDARAFSPREFETICYAVNTKIQWSSLLLKKRNIAIVMFLVLTGVRREELLGLQLSDVDLERAFVKVRAESSKSKRSRIIPINSQLTPYLEDYLFFRKKYNTSFFWVSAYIDRGLSEHGAKHFIEALSRVTKINCHLHRFRHTFATNYYQKTHDFVGLQKLMGHRSLKMTMTYLRSLPEDHLVEQIKKMSIDEIV